MAEEFNPIHSNAEVESILSGLFWGVLICADNNEPYGVPINHGYEDGRFYFHCSVEGKKLDMLQKNPSAVYVVSKYYGTKEDFQKSMRCHGCWESVLAYGTARLAKDKTEHADAFKRFMKYYGRDTFEPSEKSFFETGIIILEVEHMTAKRQDKTGAAQYYTWKK